MNYAPGGGVSEPAGEEFSVTVPALPIPALPIPALPIPALPIPALPIPALLKSSAAAMRASCAKVGRSRS